MPSAWAFSVISLANCVFVSAEILGDRHGGIVRRLRDDCLDRIFDGDGLAGLQAELCGRLFGRVLGNLERCFELDPAGIEPLEQQVERHDLGQRGRMTQRVGVRRVQHVSGVAVDDDRGNLAVRSFRRERDDERASHDASSLHRHYRTHVIRWKRWCLASARIAGENNGRCDGGKKSRRNNEAHTRLQNALDSLRTPSLTRTGLPVGAHPFCSFGTMRPP
jgi:hypothetical protein